MLKRSFFILLFCTLAGTALSQVKKQEADLKAVFIYNFTKYIDWDVNAPTNEFVIGVIGSSPVTQSLQEIAKINTVNYKRIVIKTFSRPDEIGGCQVLFIAQKSPFSLSSILGRLDRGTLTISEEAGFARLGTALNFVIVNDKLKFEANLRSIYTAGLKAGAQLLKLAIIID